MTDEHDSSLHHDDGFHKYEYVEMGAKKNPKRKSCSTSISDVRLTKSNLCMKEDPPKAKGGLPCHTIKAHYVQMYISGCPLFQKM